MENVDTKLLSVAREIFILLLFHLNILKIHCHWIPCCNAQMWPAPGGWISFWRYYAIEMKLIDIVSMLTLFSQSPYSRGTLTVAFVLQIRIRRQGQQPHKCSNYRIVGPLGLRNGWVRSPIYRRYYISLFMEGIVFKVWVWIVTCSVLRYHRLSSVSILGSKMELYSHIGILPQSKSTPSTRELKYCFPKFACAVGKLKVSELRCEMRNSHVCDELRQESASAENGIKWYYRNCWYRFSSIFLCVLLPWYSTRRP